MVYIKNSMFFTDSSRNKKVLTSIFIGLILVLVGLSIWAISLFPQSKIVAIKKEIAKANYCRVTADCQVVSAKCPFDCYAPVNKEEGKRIEDLINKYQSNCEYSCVALQGVECINNDCVVQVAITTTDIKPEQITVAGEYICLPLRATGLQTLECAIGIKTNEGKYYAFDTNRLSSTVPVFKTGDRLTANGILTPIEMLSSDHWRKYNVQGIFSVTDSLKKIDQY